MRKTGFSPGLAVFYVSCLIGTDCSGILENKTDTVVLRLNNSGPGVLDSNMIFDAHLLHANGTVVDETLYIYEWKDNAKWNDTGLTINYTKSQLQRVYSDVFNYTPGTYQMNVAVYKKSKFSNEPHGSKVANGTTEFILTDELNGLLLLQQNTTVKRKKKAFATGVPITLSANLTDNIELSNITYSWHLDNSSTVATTSTPFYNARLKDVGWQYLGVTTNGSCEIGKQKIQKTGLFKDFIWLEDRIANVTYSGNLTYLEGDLLTANVSCDGSPPFYICTNISSEPLHPENCTHFERIKKCVVQLTENMTQAGNYTVTVVVKNDVSLKSIGVKVAVKGPGVPLGASPFVPLACVVIGLFFVTLIIYTYKYERRKGTRKSETADFDFHPFQSVSSHSSTWSVERIRQTVSSWFSSSKVSSESDSSFKVLQVRNYGTISSDYNDDDDNDERL